MHSLCPTREWEREWYGVTTPNIVSGQGVILFPFWAKPPLIGEAGEVVAAEPMGAFNRDPNDLVLTAGDKLVANHLLEHDLLSEVQLESFLDDLERVPLSQKAAIFNEHPPIVGRSQDSRTRRTVYGNYGGGNHHKHKPHKLHDLPVLKRIAECVLKTAKKSVVGGGLGGATPFLTWQKFRAMTTPHSTPIAMPPSHTVTDGTLIVNCHIIPLATTRRTHSTKFSRVFAFMIVLCFRGVFEGARRNGTIRLAQFNRFPGEKHNCLLPLPPSWCYACCVCCASCVFRSGASESASGSLPTRSTRSAGAKRFTPIIPPPIFFFLPCFHPCTLPHTCTSSQWN